MADGNTAPIRRLNPPEFGTPPGYSQVVDVRASRIIFIAGQLSIARARWSEGTILPRRPIRFSET